MLTCVFEGQTYAMTVTSLASVSLVPPLVLVSIGKQARCHPVLLQTPGWAVSILTADQGELGRRFALPDRTEQTQFAGVSTKVAPTSGAAVIDDCLAWLDCRTVARHDAGDHTILVGEVAGISPLAESPAEPLTYHRGAFSDQRSH